MKHFGKKYFVDASGNSLEHKDKAKYGTANSTSTEKGKDGKLNNTSEYNHKYYEENKEKWQDNKKKSKNANKSEDDDLFYDKDGKARFGHKDYDPNDPDFKRTDGQLIEGTELRTFTNANGSTIILGKGIKFSFPPGTKITTAMAKKIAEAEKASGGNKEQYVAKMLNAVTGFADKQGLDTGGKKKKSSSSSAKKEEKKETSSSSKKEDDSEWRKTVDKYNGDGNSSEKRSELTPGETTYSKKDRSMESYNKIEEEKKKSMKHSDIALGEILIKDLFS